MAHDIRTPTNGDLRESIGTIWDALEVLREQVIPEGDATNDSHWGNISTAMAWISEALDIEDSW